jgi:hypothetical protein
MYYAAINSGGGGEGTTDYTQLENKPSINGVPLTGNKTTTDLNLSTDLSNYYTKPQTDAKNKVIKESLDGKVDKVPGKSLSTNDYTAEEKTKLAGLSNYDDTALSSRVDDLEDTVGDINTILEEVL